LPKQKRLHDSDKAAAQPIIQADGKKEKMATDNTSIIRARDVMRKGIMSIDGMATSKEAAAKMRSEKVFCLLVKKRHADDAWGIVVVQDFIKELIII